MSEFITAFFLVLGSIFIFIGALGILKFPNALMRAHALSKAMLLGISLVLLALIPSLETYAEVIKVLLAIGFLILTIPIAGHIFALYSSSER
jgi:multicomponent Na+:H+ antiporter subunit G